MADTQLARIEQALDGERLLPDVITKYKMAGDIAARTLEQLVGLCGVGANVAKLCAFGDQYITEQLAAVFNRGQVEKGIAFPTCISLNDTVANASPLEDEEPTLLKEGDVIKINLAVHIDGYIATAGITHALPAGRELLQGRAADAVSAAYVGAELVRRMLRPGARSEAIAAGLAKVAKHFGCSGVEDSFSCQMKRFVLEGDKLIPNAPSDEARSGAPFAVAVDEVYDVNVCVAAGSGAVTASDARVNVYQRNVSQRYALKLKAARALLSDVTARFPSLPFCTRHVGRRELLGLKECVDHDLLSPHPVQRAADGAAVAQCRFTVLVAAARSLTLSTPPLPPVASAVKVEAADWASFVSYEPPAAAAAAAAAAAPATPLASLMAEAMRLT